MNPTLCSDEANTVGMRITLAAIAHFDAVFIDDFGLPGDRVVNETVAGDLGRCRANLCGLDLVADSPLGDVHEMYPVAANETGGVIRDVIPIADVVAAGDTFGAKGRKWGRTQPQVVVESLRHRCDGEISSRLHTFVNPDDTYFNMC